MDTLVKLIPQSLTTQALIIGVSVGILAYLLLKKKYRLAPGPSGYPLIGNLLDMRDGLLFKKFLAWSKVYGPVFTVQIGFNKIVVLNNIEVVTEALIKKQVDFAGRPHNFTFDSMTEGGQDIVQATYGPTWKLHRKLASKALRQYLMGENLSRKVSESLVLTTDLMKKETGAFDPYPYLSLLVFNILSGVCFNKISQSTDERRVNVFVTEMQKMQEEFGSGLYEDFIPPLRLCPTPRFRRVIARVKMVEDIIREEVDEHRKTFSEANIRDFTDAMLLAQKEAMSEEDPTLAAQMTDTRVRMTVFDIFIAGIDTTRQTLHWALLAMALNQDIQKKVQNEVDKVIGPDLTISTTDRAELPYTEAVLHEVMRCRSVVPLGVPHETTRDTTVGGYDLPKGTTVMINHHALHFDPDQWEDVDEFKPERFLDASGKMAAKPESWLPFSAGRRVCLGETVARPELHLLLAGLCRAFHIELAPGTTHDFQPLGGRGVLNVPAKYKIVVKPRF